MGEHILHFYFVLAAIVLRSILTQVPNQNKARSKLEDKVVSNNEDVYLHTNIANQHFQTIQMMMKFSL